MPSIDKVNDIAPRRQYVALAGQTAFDYPFPIFNDSDVVVDVDGVTKALNADYTVSGAGNDTGGTVTFASPLAGGEVVTLYRDIAIARDTDFQQNGPFRADALNDELDKVFLILQQLKASHNRALRMPVTASATDAQMELAPLDNWLGKYVTINAQGVPEPADIVSGTISKSVIGQLLYPRTAAEVLAGVAVVDYGYPEGVPNRYAVNATPGTTDMTAAIQAAINVMVIGGCEVRLLTEDYRITDELLIPTAQGWRIVGADQKTSRIIQAADNKAIFRFTGCNNHGWKISNLWLQYVNSQATNAGAMCIAFEGDDTLPQSIAYDAEVSNLYVLNAYLLAGIVSNGVIRRGVWAMRHRNLHLYTHGGIVDYGSAAAYMRAGPSMVFENVYLRGDNMTQPCMILAAGQGVLRNIEANQLKTTLLDLRGGGSWFVDHVVVENMALTGANCAMINFADVQLDVRYVHLFGNSCTWDPGVGNSAYVFRFTGGSNSTTSLSCKLLDLINFGGATTAVLSGTLFVHNAYAASGDTHVKFGDIKGLAGISNAYLTSVPASGAATCTYVEGWQREEWTADIGDADYTVTPGVTPRNIRADSALTANRAVILPTGSANSSCFAGMRYRIHRTAGGTGNLTIRDAAGNVFATIPAGIVGTIEVTFIRTAIATTSWRVTLADLRPSAPYTVTNLSEDKTYNAASTTAGELANVLGTLIQDLARSRRLS